MKGKSRGRRILSPTKNNRNIKKQNNTKLSLKKSFSSPNPTLSNLPTKRNARTLPKSEIELNMDKTVTFSTHFRNSDEEIEIYGSKTLTEVSLKDDRNLLIEKCNECSKICDFTSDKKDIKAKSIKSTLLKQITSSFSNPHISRTLSNDVIKSFFYMIGKNIFRTFPIIKHYGPSDFNDSIFDSAWPHISLAYECLNASSNSPSLKEFPPKFLSNLVDNTLSPDERERKEAKAVLNNIYNRFPSSRLVIRHRCSYIFINQKCSSELLDFYYTVVSGFSPPLKNETIIKYQHEILPLHCLSNYSSYYNYLVQVVYRFIAKSEILLQYTLTYLNKHWPCTDRKKQTLFLREYEDLVVNFDNRMNKEMAFQFFRKINECITNESTDIACTALEILQNPMLHFFVKNNAANLYFMLIISISTVATEHWNDDTRDMAKTTLEVLNQIEPNAYRKAAAMQKSIKSMKTPFCGIPKTKWKKLIGLAKYYDTGNLQFDIL